MRAVSKFLHFSVFRGNGEIPYGLEGWDDLLAPAISNRRFAGSGNFFQKVAIPKKKKVFSQNSQKKMKFVMKSGIFFLFSKKSSNFFTLFPKTWLRTQFSKTWLRMNPHPTPPIFHRCSTINWLNLIQMYVQTESFLNAKCW